MDKLDETEKNLIVEELIRNALVLLNKSNFEIKQTRTYITVEGSGHNNFVCSPNMCSNAHAVIFAFCTKLFNVIVVMRQKRVSTSAGS